MKNRLITRACLALGVAALNLAFLPSVMAQAPSDSPANPASPNSAQDSKTTDSTAEQHSATASNPTDTGTLEKNNSKNMTNSLDMNAPQTSSNSQEKTATKEPNEKMDAKSSHHGMAMDKKFIMNASQGGMLEVQLGKVAQDKAESSDVKDFGSRMVTDHSAANDKLMAIAKDKGLDVPTELNSEHQAVVDRLSKLSGPAFDKAYVAEMLKDHKKDAAAFQDEANSTHDAALKDFATDTLKVVKMHLAMIKDIHAKMGKK